MLHGFALIEEIYPIIKLKTQILIKCIQFPMVHEHGFVAQLFFSSFLVQNTQFHLIMKRLSKK